MGSWPGGVSRRCARRRSGRRRGVEEGLAGGAVAERLGRRGLGVGFALGTLGFLFRLGFLGGELRLLFGLGEGLLLLVEPAVLDDGEGPLLQALEEDGMLHPAPAAAGGGVGGVLVVLGVGERGVETADRAGVGGDGAVVVPRGLEGEPQVGKGVAAVGVLLHGALEGLDPFVDLTGITLRGAEADLRVDVAGHELERAPVVRHGVLRHAELAHGGGEIVGASPRSGSRSTASANTIRAKRSADSPSSRAGRGRASRPRRSAASRVLQELHEAVGGAHRIAAVDLRKDWI